MKRIEESKLDKITGGAVSPVLIYAIVSAAAVFLAGVIDGIVNPEKCN